MKRISLNAIKQKLKECLIAGTEPEICFTLNDNDYMIIPLKDKISFQCLNQTEEIYFSSVEELFSTELQNNIKLERDWSKVKKVWYY